MTDYLLRSTLALIAPGTGLRESLERILRGNTGALIVLGYDKVVESVCSGGFTIQTDFTATKLRELAKMDGAIVMSTDGLEIIKAAVHLVPDPSIATEESGTRHRTAERVAKQTGYPVISVSQSMRIVALYVGGRRYVLDDAGAILSRANQALATLERYKLRLDEVSGTLSALEIEDLVTSRDVVGVLQRLEMVRRIALEIDGYLVELGSDGRLLSLQVDELMADVEPERELVVRDYMPTPHGRKPRTAAIILAELADVDALDLLDLAAFANILGIATSSDDMENPLTPRGYRLTAKIPRLPAAILDRIVDHFGGMQKLLAASIDDLQAVEGVGEMRARTIRDTLSRLAESSILERYV